MIAGAGDDMREAPLAVPVGVATVATLAVTAGGAAAARTGPAAAARTAAAAVRTYPNVSGPGQRRSRGRGLTTTAQGARPDFKFACYRPGQSSGSGQLQELYARGINGRGRTIVMVNMVGVTGIRRDLGRRPWIRPAQPSPSLKIIQPAGKVPPFKPTARTAIGWAGETTLDVEYVAHDGPGRQHPAGRDPGRRDRGHATASRRSSRPRTT